MQIWRVNAKTQQLTCEPVPEGWQHLGGRGLLARILVDEGVATCDPLGPHNKLIFAPGLLVGHMLSSCDRISVGAKSPLTGGIKESNAGGSTGLKITYLGIAALILEDQPTDDGWWVLHLSKAGARFDAAGEAAGKGVYAAAPLLRARYGDGVAISLIGQGGEMRMAGAGIQNLDKDLVPSRINARGGMGAVMGSKRLKAIVFDASEGKAPPIADRKAFNAARKSYNRALLDHPQTKIYADYGTAAMTKMCNSFGALPTRNFSDGQFEDAELISGEHLREVMLERGGESDTTHACMVGCAIQCSNIYADTVGEAIVSPIEYETIGLMGSNLGLNDLDTIARLNYQVNDLGLDSIEVGAALGVAADAGLMAFGDGERALALLAEIRQGTPLGRLLGNGASITGKALGVRRVPAVKGQALSAYDPRSIKGTGVTYATSPQGADHTCGLTIRAKIDHLSPEGQIAVSRVAQINMAGYDTLGACIFAGSGFAAQPQNIRDLLNARYGWEVGDDILQALGRDCLKLEREFNRLAGFSAEDDRLPEWMTEEALPPHNVVFDVSSADLDSVFNW
jgi:aldehyde:ferredoxin oxidoreductase